ncbi:MAG: hypothetical protein H6736_22525 [Alphaproteobacteria bacterium]|nr:hypothetical protein [Alphaproteobacteria bacterium]MCB9694595.1 hypothetical protein [Alphaproteobacteria bacterium]
MSDALDDAVGPEAPDPLLEQLRAIAAAFTEDEADLARLFDTLAADVDRARREPLPIFPVIHHSPASAVHMVRWLRERRPKLVFIEMCEDLVGLVPDLRDCTLPVALQAFAGEVEGHPASWTPLSVVAPLTEFSAEYQAMAYALQDPEVELVFVDRSVDHVFQWADRTSDPETPVHDDEDDDEEARLHGSAVGIELGGIEPTFRDFHDLLLANARMTHFEEWTSLYVEEPTIGANTATYRAILFLVGSLFRRLGSTPHAREEIRRRDRLMWTRIKGELAKRSVPPEECVFVCGAAHAVEDGCPEWGLASEALYDPGEPTDTRWLYGFIPSSYAAIELQFGHARGAVAMAESRWKKALSTWNLEPYTISRKPPRTKPKVAKPPMQLSLDMVLTGPPRLADADAAELLGWVTGIVQAARKNRYLASTADAIAIYETSILLARMRSRKRPSPFDFIDAAETCLEKGRPPGRRSVRQLCNRMLGGDRVGQVGYDSLPPLVQDVYDRLAPLGITAQTRRITRVLLDFTQEPEKRRCSRLLWRLSWLTPGTRVARPIMGELKLGMEPRQESWDVGLHGAEQRAVIQLAFEGVTVEQVLEKRLSADTFGQEAKTVTALRAVEGSLILLDNPRLSEALGRRSIELLDAEVGADDAEEIFATVRRLVAHFRTTADGLPGWLQDFVATGYAHYSTQLPEGFADRGTRPEQLAAMLAFVFTLESLALAMGCSRSQLVIAIELAGTQTAEPEKKGLLWAAEWLVQLRDEDELRRAFADVLEHPLGRQAYPRYLSGLLAALSFAPRIAPLGVELLGRAFAELPDRVLLPWMPALLTSLRDRQGDVLPALFKEVTRTLPRSLAALDTWVPPWDQATDTAETPSTPVRSEAATAGRTLVGAHPEATDAWARAVGAAGSWGEVPVEAPSETGEPHPLLVAHPDALQSWSRLLGR